MIKKVPQTEKKTRSAVKYGVFTAIILIIMFYFRDSIRDILYEVENTSLEEVLQDCDFWKRDGRCGDILSEPKRCRWCQSYRNESVSAALMAVTFTLVGVIPAPSGFGSLELVFVLLYGRITGNAKAVSAILLFRFVTNIIPFVIGAVENFRFQKVTGQGRKEKDAAFL